jgi:2-iminobutanoate/2-iminopropanoate deaminase
VTAAVPARDGGPSERPAVPEVTVAGRGGVFAITGLHGGSDTEDPPAEPAAQFEAAFARLRQELDNAGLSPDEVGRVTVVTPDPAYRPLINPPWLETFPDENRPARRTTHAPLPGGLAVELEAAGVRGERRQPVEISGVRHKDPLPMGALVGRHLFSSAIVADAPDGSAPGGLAAIHQAFDNLAALVTAAGGTLDDIANVWVYLGLWDLHDYMVDTWVETFPDPASRPTRKTFYYPRTPIQLQCEAVLGAGSRANFEIEGLAHRDPIPMAARTGGLFTTSGVDGRDPSTGKAPRGVGPQSCQALDNLLTLLAAAGSGAGELFGVTALVGQLRYREAFLEAWRQAAAYAAAAPALSVLELGLPARDYLVQVIGRGITSS